MTGKDIRGREAACRMRALSPSERDEAIDNSGNVVDFRPVLNQRRKNRSLAEFYRQAFARKPPDGAA